VFDSLGAKIPRMNRAALANSPAARCGGWLGRLCSGAPQQTMENALYYTLSTIAQTLAGTLAILVAVVLFKLSALSRAIDIAKERFRNLSIDTRTAWPILRDKGVDILAQTLANELSLHPHGLLRQDFQAAHAAYQDWGRINWRLYSALGVTVLDIGLCFAVLPFTPRIACSPWASGLTLFSIVGLGTTSLCLYVRLIVAMVGRPAE
jgi:hypothetical protein